MRALRMVDGKPTLDGSLRAPACAPGEALVRPTLTGITEIDVAIARGDVPLEGIESGVFGHEFVGVVEAVGEGVEARGGKSLVGQRVVGAMHAPCGVCELCRGGLGNHCRDRTVLGLRGRAGCFAERFTIPARSLAAAPKNVADEAALFAGAVADALHIAQQVRIEGRTYITVLGETPLALLTAQVLARLNASVRLLAKSEQALALCERWGVRRRPEGEAGRRGDQDVVVDCTGTVEGLATALEMVRPRGRVVLKGRAGAGLWRGEVELGRVVEDEVEVIGSRSGSVEAAMAELAGGRLQTEGLLTRRVKFEQAAEALRLAAGGGQIRVAMDMPG